MAIDFGKFKKEKRKSEEKETDESVGSLDFSTFKKKRGKFFKGKGFGVSERKDPESGRPLLRAPQTIPETFNTPEFDIQLESPRRVATTFDPTRARSLTRDEVSRSDDRLATSKSQAIRAELGAGFDEELDHLIALTLSGSNVDENLKLINKKTNRDFGKQEAQLAREVIAGKKSLLDAQLEMAKKKGIDLPESEPKLRQKVQNFALKFSPNTLESMAEFQTDPFGLETADIEEAPEAFINTITTSVNQAGDSLADLIRSFQTDERTSKKVGKGLETLAKTGGSLLSPVSALFAAGDEIPFVKAISKVASMPFEIAGEGGRLLTDRMLDEGILSTLDEQTKEDIRKGANEIGALTAQLAIGKAGHVIGRKTVPSAKAKAFKTELAKEVPELRRGSERVVSINDVPNKTINKFISKHGRSKAKEIIKESLKEQKKVPKGMKPKEAEVIRNFKEEVRTEITESPADTKKVRTDTELINRATPDQTKDLIETHGYDGAKAIFKTSLETASGIKRQMDAGKTPKQIGREMSQSVKKIEEPAETRTTGTAEAVEARAIEKKLVDKVEDKAKFEPTKFKAQSEKVADIINNDPARARKIVKGEEALPENINSGAMIQGVQLLAERTGNSKIIKELANSPLAKKISEAAQELGSARLIERDSVYKDMSDLKKFREKKAEATTKKTKNRLVKEMKKEQEKVNLSKKEVKSFDRFLEKIEC